MNSGKHALVLSIAGFGTFETCRGGLLMSVHRGGPEEIGRGLKRRF
jgi:hypothetical protein